MRFPFRGYTIGRLLLTTCNQGGGAPVIDRATSTTEDGRCFEGRAILLTPWRRNRHGEAEPQRALFIGTRRRRAAVKRARWERIGEWMAEHGGDRIARFWALWMHVGCALRGLRDCEGSWVTCYSCLSPVRYADAWHHETNDGGKHLQCGQCQQLGSLLRQAARAEGVTR